MRFFAGSQMSLEVTRSQKKNKDFRPFMGFWVRAARGGVTTRVANFANGHVPETVLSSVSTKGGTIGRVYTQT